MTDRDVIDKWAVGALSSRRGEFTDLDTEVKRVFRRRVVSIPIPADAQASDTTAETIVYQVPAAAFANGVKVVEAKLGQTTKITGHASNYATLKISWRDGAGGAATDIGTIATSATPSLDIGAMAPRALTITAANADVPAGGVITYQVAKAGGGVALVAGTLELTLEAL